MIDYGIGQLLKFNIVLIAQIRKMCFESFRPLNFLSTILFVYLLKNVLVFLKFFRLFLNLLCKSRYMLFVKNTFIMCFR